MSHPITKTAEAILRRSRNETLVGWMSQFSRKGARKIQQVFLSQGVAKINGQPTKMTFDTISSIHWNPA